jgi:hypothetical protein
MFVMRRGSRPEKLTREGHAKPTRDQAAQDRHREVQTSAGRGTILKESHRLVIETRIRGEAAKEPDRDRGANSWGPTESQGSVHDGANDEAAQQVDDESADRKRTSEALSRPESDEIAGASTGRSSETNPQESFHADGSLTAVQSVRQPLIEI